MDIKNVKAEQVDIKKEVVAPVKPVSIQKAVEVPAPVKVEQVKPAEAKAKTADSAPVNPTRHYVVPDISANSNFLSDMNRVNNDIKMIDLKRYGYEQDIEKIKAGLSTNSKEENSQIHEINELRAKIADADLDRSAVVAEIKRKIDAGEYKASGTQIVEGIEKYRQ
jgi:anti-sigma28 factor (negative regulator of flagellin synthesis)